MTLTTRLTLFYLGTLAAVLAAFSGTLYTLAHRHLHAELHDRTSGLLDIVTARAEVEPEGVEWEPKHSIPPLPHERNSHFWAVYSSTRARLDGGGLPTLETDGYAVRRTICHPDADSLPTTLEPHRYRSLEFVAALPTAPMDRVLRTLAYSLLGTSAMVWLVCAFAARRLCRWALRPVATMAAGAQSISPDQLGERLPMPEAEDELRELAAAFNGVLVRFQTSFERQRRFTGEASHQLRTPLAAMLGQIEVALRRDRDPTDYRAALSTINVQALRMQEIIESLLFLARADADAMRPVLRRIDLRDWLPTYVRETWSTHLRWPDMIYEVGISEPTRAEVDIHPLLLGQALGNLLDNALKFSRPGTPVAIRVEHVESSLMLGVKDGGGGIAESDRARLFEPFFRSEDARSAGVPGVGLGLAIAARIVESMGATIRCDCPPDGGSHFRILFRPVQPHDTSASD